MSAPSAVTQEGGRVGYKDKLKHWAHRTLDPIVGGLSGAGVKPDHLTVAGFILSVGAAIAFYEGQMRVGAFILIAAGICDILDGQIARRTQTATRFGAFFDSTLDRVAEAVVLIGLAGFYCSNLLGLYGKAAALVTQVASGEIEGPFALVILRQQPIDPRAWVVLTLTSMLALTGSFMVSYTRARAEGLGLDCKVGWFERPERIVLLIVAGLAQVFWAMSAALMLLTILSFFTAAQRMVHVYRITRAAGADHTEV
ncbi:MAG: CDP-alcohol phosphatidyltransferase family protein [Candidatus Eisenbacteria bacterium]